MYLVFDEAKHLSKTKKKKKKEEEEGRYNLKGTGIDGYHGLWVGQKVGKTGEGGQKVKTCSYKIRHEDITYSVVPVVNNTVLHLWNLLQE